MTTPSTHDARTIFFHWACAALIIVLWGLGQTIDWFPKDTPRIMARSAHIALGALLAVLLVARLQWRRSGANHLPPAIDGTMGRVATRRDADQQREHRADQKIHGCFHPAHSTPGHSANPGRK